MDPTEKRRELVQRLSAEAHARGDTYGWFERLYRGSGGDTSLIPWADLEPNPLMTGWLAEAGAPPAGATALVVGCGLGDDAEHLAVMGFTTTAFDVAPSSVAWCRRRFPAGRVRYEAADLLDPPAQWTGAFDLVVEANTLQVLTRPLQERAMANLASFLAPGGTLLVIARLRDEGEPLGDLPWPLRVSDLAPLDARLSRERFDDLLDRREPPVRRMRVVYRRRG